MRIGSSGGYSGWGCVVTSLVPLGIAFATYKRRSNRGAIKEVNLTEGEIDGFNQPSLNADLTS